MKSIIGRLLVGASVCAIAITGIAIASAGSPGLEQPRVLRFKIVEEQNKVVFSDLDKSGGPSAGDQLLIEETLLDFDSGTKPVGSAHSACTRLIRPGRFHCETTTYVAGGRIETAGVIQAAGRTEVAVVGGTGGYDNARGYAAATSASGVEVTTFYLEP